MSLKLITDHEVKALFPYTFKHSVAILLYYDEMGVLIDNPDQFKIPQPYGISGGGLWASPTLPEGRLWSPDSCMLIGIERGWLEMSRIAICTQMQHWLKLIAKEYSDLTSCINDHLSSFI